MALTCLCRACAVPFEIAHRSRAKLVVNWVRNHWDCLDFAQSSTHNRIIKAGSENTNWPFCHCEHQEIKLDSVDKFNHENELSWLQWLQLHGLINTWYLHHMEETRHSLGVQAILESIISVTADRIRAENAVLYPRDSGMSMTETESRGGLSMDIFADAEYAEWATSFTATSRSTPFHDSLEYFMMVFLKYLSCPRFG